MDYLLRDIDPKLHHALKTKALEQNKTLKQFIIDIFTAAVEKTKGEKA